MTDLYTDVYVSQHALERLREHYPNIGIRGVLDMLSTYPEVAPGEVSGFLERIRPPTAQDHYHRVPWGLLVVAPMDREHPVFRWSVVTYVRFSPAQQARADVLWPRSGS